MEHAPLCRLIYLGIHWSDHLFTASYHTNPRPTKTASATQPPGLSSLFLHPLTARRRRRLDVVARSMGKVKNMHEVAFLCSPDDREMNARPSLLWY